MRCLARASSQPSMAWRSWSVGLALFEGHHRKRSRSERRGPAPEEAGKTVIVGGTSSSVWCVVAVQDAVRAEASEAVRLLHARGVELIVLSGTSRSPWNA